MWQESAVFCGSTHFFYIFASLVFACCYQAIPRQKEGRWERRERPPLFCRSSGKQERGFVAGFVAYPAPLFGGRPRLHQSDCKQLILIDQKFVGF